MASWVGLKDRFHELSFSALVVDTLYLYLHTRTWPSDAVVLGTRILFRGQRESNAAFDRMLTMTMIAVEHTDECSTIHVYTVTFH